MVTDNTVLYSALPPALSGFENITRYWDTKNNIYAAKIIQGEYYVSMNNELITTVLGSCVSACIRDKKTGIGGMNHFMLPGDKLTKDNWRSSPVSVAASYGTVAMERLINAILANGGSRENLETKLFGGGRVLNITTDVGKDNIEFVRKYLKNENIRIVAEDLGGDHPRKILYYPATGRAFVKKLFRLHNETFYARERKYINELEKQPVKPDVELF
jgi:chemotaxis protein CheD